MIAAGKQLLIVPNSTLQLNMTILDNYYGHIRLPFVW